MARKELSAITAMRELLDDHADVLYCAKALDGRYLEANTAFVRAAGQRSRASLLGRTARDFFPPHLVDSYERQDQIAIEHGAVRRQFELIGTSEATAAWFLTTKLLIPGDSPEETAIACVSRDQRRVIAQSGARAVIAALDHLERHLAEPLDVERLASSVGVSAVHLRRLLHATIGASPSELLRRIRIEHATKAIASSTATLAEIAADCGWYDHAAMTRDFRRVLSITPSSLRPAQR